MILFTIVMSGMHASVRHISQNMHPFEAAFFRLIFGLVAIIPFFYKQGFGVLKTKRLPMLWLRGLINAGCMLGFFYALSIGPLARITALGFTATLFAIVLAVLIFRERVGLKRWAAILFGFAGMIVIVRPGFVDIGIESIVTLGAAFGWAACIIIIKDLAKTESAATITAYMSLTMAPISTPIKCRNWTPASGCTWTNSVSGAAAEFVGEPLEDEAAHAAQRLGGEEFDLRVRAVGLHQARGVHYDRLEVVDHGADSSANLGAITRAVLAVGGRELQQLDPSIRAVGLHQGSGVRLDPLEVDGAAHFTREAGMAVEFVGEPFAVRIVSEATAAAWHARRSSKSWGPSPRKDSTPKRRTRGAGYR